MTQETSCEFGDPVPEHGPPVHEARPVSSDALEIPPTLPGDLRIWTVLVILVLAFTANVLVGAVYLVVAGSIVGDGRGLSGDILERLAQQPMLMLGMLLCSMVTLTIVALIGAWASPVRWYERLRLRSPKMSAGQIVSAALGATAIGMILTMTDALGFIPRSPTLESLAETVSGLLGTNLLAGVVVIGLMPGIAEELFFRGYIQTRLSERWGVHISVFITAAFFGAYHLDWVQSPFAFVMGLFLGAVAERASSIVPAMIAHATNNTFGILVSAWAPESSPRALYWGVVLVAAIVMVVCIRNLRRGPDEVPGSCTNPESTGGPEGF